MAKLTLNINIVPKLATNAIADIKKDIATKLSSISKSGINIIDENSLDNSKKKVSQLVENIKKSITGIKDTKVDIEADASKVESTFKKIPKEAETAGKKSGDSFGSSFGSTVKKVLAGAAIFSVFAAGASAVKAAAGEFKDFNSQLQNVSSLGVPNVDALGKKINELSKTTVDTAANLTGGLYQAVSAGITGTQEDLVKFIDRASKVAVAGNATTESAVNSLTSVMNAYKLSVGDAGKVSDIFFGAIKGGKTTFNELDASLANVIPAASGAGIAFQEIAGNIAQMTALGTPTAQATTQLRAAIVELQKPGADLAKVMSGVTVEIGGVKQSLNENNIGQVLKQQGLTATLQQIEQSATASGKSLTQVFSSTEAAGAALLLTGENAETANKQLQNIKKGIEEGVSTSAFEAQFKSLDNQMKLVKNNIQAGFNTIFTALLPVVNNLLQTIIPVISKIFEGITPVIEQLATTIGPILNGLLSVIQPVIDLLAGQLAPLLTNIIGKIVKLLVPIASLLAPIFGALGQIFEKISPILDQLVSVLVDGLGSAIQSLVPLITTLASALGGILGDALSLFLGIIVELVKNNLDLINVVAELLTALTPIISVVLQLVASLVKLGVQAIKPLIPIIADLLSFITILTTKILGAVVAVAKFFGLIDSKKPQAPFKKVSDSAVDATKNVETMNTAIANQEPAKVAEKITTTTKATGRAHKDNTKYAVDYFNALKDGQADALKMLAIEDEISRIREERSKNTNDELIEQQREFDALLDRRNKLVESLKQGFVLDDKGKKIQITAEERVDLTEMLANLNTDLKFASKDIEKLKVKIEIDKKAADREVQLTIEQLQRERLEIEVDMGIRPKGDLLAAYKKDLEKLNVSLAGAEGVEQEKLQNEKLKKLQQIQRLQEELNKDAASNAALAYNNSLNAVIDNFANGLDDAFKNIKPDTSRITAINEEISKIGERRTKTLQDYKNGKINAQEYNSAIVDIEKDKQAKLKELDDAQLSRVSILAVGLGNAFDKLAEQYSEMAKSNLNDLKLLSKKELEYQDLQRAGKEIPAELSTAHQEYADKTKLAFLQVGVAAASTFTSLLVQGKLTAKSFAQLALDSLDAIVPILVAEIFGQAFAQLGPIGGAIAGASTIALFKGLVAIAKAGIGGANTGLYRVSKTNRGKQGNGDIYPTMLAEDETVLTAKTTLNNPIVEHLYKGGTEEQYITKQLHKMLAKHKISLPNLNVALMPLTFDSKGVSEANEAAKYLQKIDEKYKKIDKEQLSIAIERDRQANNESKRQNDELIAHIKQLHNDNESMKEEIKSLKRDFSHKTKTKVEGEFRMRGDDMIAVIDERNRRRLD